MQPTQTASAARDRQSSSPWLEPASIDVLQPKPRARSSRRSWRIAAALAGMLVALATYESLRAEYTGKAAWQDLARARQAELAIANVVHELRRADDLGASIASLAVARRDSPAQLAHALHDLDVRSRIADVVAWGVLGPDICTPQICQLSDPNDDVDTWRARIDWTSQAQALGIGEQTLLRIAARASPLLVSIRPLHAPPHVRQNGDTHVIDDRVAFIAQDIEALLARFADARQGVHLSVRTSAMPTNALEAGTTRVTHRSGDLMVTATFASATAARSAVTEAFTHVLAAILGLLAGLAIEHGLHTARARNAGARWRNRAMTQLLEAHVGPTAPPTMLVDMAKGVACCRHGTCPLETTLRKPTAAEIRAAWARDERAMDIPKAAIVLRPGVLESGLLEVRPLPDIGPDVAMLRLLGNSASEALRTELEQARRDDPLTGLLARHAVLTRLDQLLGEYNRPDLAIFGIEIDELDMIQALHGLNVGDSVVKEVSQRLLLNSVNLLLAGRIGDNLLVSVCTATDADAVSEDLQRLAGALHQASVCVSTSEFRIATWTAATFVASTVWGNADLVVARLSEAMNRARTTLSRTSMFRMDREPSSSMDRAGEAAWLQRIRTAMANDDLILAGQRCPVSGAHNGPAHAEVLVRMRAEDGSLIPPGAFLPIAERYELIRELDRYILARACRHLRALLQQFAEPEGTIAVNLSARTLSDPGFLDFLHALLAETQVVPAHLCLEITESAAFGDFAWTCRLVGEIRKLGFRVAIDDFGVGMASFSYLKQVPADYVKIDGSFVRDICENELSQRICSAITDIGHAVGMHVIAEWVANAAIEARLTAMGVDYLQGFHLHVPEVAEFEIQLLENRSA